MKELKSSLDQQTFLFLGAGEVCVHFDNDACARCVLCFVLRVPHSTLTLGLVCRIPQHGISESFDSGTFSTPPVLFQAAIGIANLLTMALVEQGLSQDEARARIWMIDINGLLTKVTETSLRSQ